MNKIAIKLDIARFAKHVNFTYWVIWKEWVNPICHACESRHPELLILLDSRFRGNDGLYDKIAQFR
jgi:hypothetical protein